MCNRTEKLELCACLDMNTNKIQKLYSEEIKRLDKQELLKVAKWELNRFLGTTFSEMDGLVILPSQNLTKELSEEFILRELNNSNCFDFEYQPSEGDNLIFTIGWLFNKWGKKMNPEIEYKYSSYIFRSGEWKPDFYNPFYEKTEIINKGVLKKHHKPT